MQQAWALAIMNARFYQYNLEQVYLAALPVTLQRFAFEPQFYGSLGQVTGVPQNGSGAAGVFLRRRGLLRTRVWAIPMRRGTGRTGRSRR